MPNIGENITVKIIGKVEKGKEDFYCPIRIWSIRGHRLDNIYRMKITKTLWNSLDNELIIREEFGEFGGSDIGNDDENENENLYKIDEDLECIVGKIITISGISDITRSYKNKYGVVEYPKIFKTTIREDLQEIEKIGGQEFIDACNKERENNDRCINTNFTTINTMRLMKEVSERKTYGIIKTDKKGKKDKGLDDYWNYK